MKVNKNISTIDQLTLEQSSSILTLELVKKQTITEIYYKKTHEQFERLLHEQDSNQFIQLANELGLTTTSDWMVSSFRNTK